MNDMNEASDPNMIEIETSVVTAMQDEIDSLRAGLETAMNRVAELEAAQPAPAGDGQLRSLAATYVAARRNGHPDASKHLDSLLRALGAV